MHKNEDFMNKHGGAIFSGPLLSFLKGATLLLFCVPGHLLALFPAYLPNLSALPAHFSPFTRITIASTPKNHL